MTEAGAERRIEWTGERCVPWADDLEVIYEHYQRYLFVAPLAKGRRVLDLACGEGYGADILAVGAAQVLGIEIDMPTVEHARATYRRENLAFKVGDMLDLSALDDSSFDLVVCFEALEHVEDHVRLLEGVRRVLAPEGVFAVSTPDRLAYEEMHAAENPFHVHELSRAEFTEFVSGGFAHVRMWGQNVCVGSVIFDVDVALGPDAGSSPGQMVPLVQSGEHWASADSFTPTYLVALASDAPIGGLPGFTTLIDPGLELVRGALRARHQEEALWSGFAEETLALLSRAENEVRLRKDRERVLRELVKSTRDQARGYIQELESANQRTSEQGVQRGRELVVEAAERDRARERVAQLEVEIAELRNSPAYRLGRRSYGVARRLIPTQYRESRYVGGILRRVEAIATGLPRRSASAPSAPPELGPGRPTSMEPVSAPLPAPREEPLGPLPHLVTSDAPRVSIVIPVYNNWALTRNCLWSLAEDVSATPYEVIVVDDASSDLTAGGLAQVGGIRSVRLESNRGFARAVQAGAELARGGYLVLLNNDTEILEGWLDALVEAADSDSQIGVVGARLLYPDGLLQEAGGVIFDDGHGWNYGRSKDAGHPSFNFRRDVDFCSGACLLVRRHLWEEIGGFDPSFETAYYEDVDLAFSARQRGYRVVYEPNCRVVHREGSSYGTDDSPRKRQLMETNREIFVNKWRNELTEQLPYSERNVRAASWRSPRGHALVIDHQTPTFDQDAGSLRMFEIIRILVGLGYAVTFVPHNGGDVPRYTRALEELGVAVLHGPLDLPWLIAELSPRLELAVLSRPFVAWPVVPLIREISPKTQIIYDTVDLHFVRESRRAELEEDKRAGYSSMNYREMEIWLANACDMVFVVSESEKTLLLAEAPDALVGIVPTIHRWHTAGPNFSSREGLLFVGGFNHPPNVDAVSWLIEEILPLIRKSIPDVHLVIAGSSPPDAVRDLAGEGIDVLGWVENLDPLYARARLMVAPLRYGAGIRGKIGESAARGLPVVSTTLGAEGLNFARGEAILIGDSADEFAAEVARAYSDEHAWNRVRVNARRAIALQTAPEKMRVEIARLLDELRPARSRKGTGVVGFHLLRQVHVDDIG